MNPVIRYVFAALLLLGSTSLHAGYYWKYTFQNGVIVNHPTSDVSVCEANNYNGYVNVHKTINFTYSHSCKGHVPEYPNQYPQPFGSIERQGGTCPTEMVEDGSGNCIFPPPEPCEAGGDVFTARWSLDQLNTEGFQPYVIDANGCLYDATSVVQCGVYQDGVTACLYEYTQTANSTDGAQYPQPEEYTDNTNVEQSVSDDTGSTTFIKDPPITNPDGSTVQTTQETTVNTSGSGAEIWNDDTHFYIRDSTGTTTIYDRQKTVNTNTDASIDETIVVSKSHQTPTTKTTTVNTNNGNSSTVTNNQSTTNNTTTTTVNNYDSNGNLTDSTSNTEGGTETEGDENEEGNCGAPNQPPCDVTLDGSDQLTDPQLAIDQSGILNSIDDYIGEIDKIGEDDISANILNNPFNLPSVGNCNPANFTIDYRGNTLSPMARFCQVYDDTLHPILQFFFYMFTLITLYFTFLRATERT